jgi:CDP-glucose 4,6-dehydratase
LSETASVPAPEPKVGPASPWRDRSVLLTGATGLLGGYVARSLILGGAGLVTLVRDRAPESLFSRWGLHERAATVRGDVTDQALLERVIGEYEVEVVIHLAAQTLVTVANRNPVSTFDTNIRGTWALLEACRRSPRLGAVVVASSDKAYGDQGGAPYTEDLPLLGAHPYDASKAAADRLAQTYAATWGLPIGITRCGNLFGGGDLNWSRVVPGTVRSLLRGERPVVRSDGSPVRDWFYVEDGAAATLHLAARLLEDRSLHGQAWNLSAEAPLSVSALVAQITAQMGLEVEPVIQGQGRGEIQSQRLDAAKARRRLGWAPRFSMAEGIDRSVAWYRDLLTGGAA